MKVIHPTEMCEELNDIELCHVDDIMIRTKPPFPFLTWEAFAANERVLRLRAELALSWEIMVAETAISDIKILQSRLEKIKEISIKPLS